MWTPGSGWDMAIGFRRLLGHLFFALFPGRPQGWRLWSKSQRGQGPPRHLTYTLKELLVLWAPGTPCWHSKPTPPRIPRSTIYAKKICCANSLVDEFTWWDDVTIQPRGVTWCHTHAYYIYIYCMLFSHRCFRCGNPQHPTTAALSTAKRSNTHKCS